MSFKEKLGKSKEKNPNIKKIIIGVIAAIIVIEEAAFFLTANSRKYSFANADFNAKKFEEALEKYESLGDYKDSAKRVDECKYELTVDGQFMRAMSEGLWYAGTNCLHLRIRHLKMINQVRMQRLT